MLYSVTQNYKKKTLVQITRKCAAKLGVRQK